MEKTTNCVVCYTPEVYYTSGHVHKNGEKITATSCKKCYHLHKSAITDCKGCYGEWNEKMGYEDTNFHPERIYGTYKSDLLKEVIKAGHNPIAITTMLCEESFVFETNEEANKAAEQFMPEGWWYALDDRDHPWQMAWEKYVRETYKGNEEHAPTVYWLKTLYKDMPHCLAYDRETGKYVYLFSDVADHLVKSEGRFEVKQRYKTVAQAKSAEEKSQPFNRK